MLSVDLRTTGEVWNQLREHARISFRKGLCPETGAIGLLGESASRDRHEFLLAKLILPQPGDLKVASFGELVFDASYIRRAHLEMRRHKLAGIAFIHTHPAADSHVQFSPYDDEQEPQLVSNLRELAPWTNVVSVVLGKQSQRGRLWRSPLQSLPLQDLVIVGEELRYLPLNGLPAPAPPVPEAIFDRAMTMTGAGALARLSQMRVAVIGASGTRSIMCLLLANAGCKHILLIDHDILKEHNRHRMMFATARAAAASTPKVEVVRSGIEALGLDCHVEAIMEPLLSEETVRRLRSVDVVIGCVDKALPRKLLSSFSYQFLRPYIDVGSEIGGDRNGIVSLDARASYVAPGRPCLQCTGVVTARRLSFESLGRAERQRVVELGYSDDLLIKQPAVMELNMSASRLGAMMLRHLLQPYLLEPLPLAITENLVTYTTRPIRAAKDDNLACPTCRANQHTGHGDNGPPIGLSEVQVEGIVGNWLKARAV